MECNDFLEGYSAYRDGRLEPGEREAFREHMEGCDSCARYDRVVRKGTDVLRDLPSVDPPADFQARLQHRIYHVEDGIPLSSSFQGGSAALVAVAAVSLLAMAWLPFAARGPVEVELPAVAVEAPPERQEPPRADRLVNPGPFVRPAAGIEAVAETLPEWSDARLLPVRSPSWRATTLGAGPAFTPVGADRRSGAGPAGAGR